MLTGNMLIDIVLTPWQFLTAPAQRIFWPCLLFALFIAFCFLRFYQQQSIKAIAAKFFNSAYWFHPSSLIDFSLMYLNTIIKIVVIVPLLASHLTGIILVSKAFQYQLGDSPLVNWPPFAVMVLFSIIFFIVEDASRFYLHRLMHQVPWLWRFHQLHHSAEVLTPMTLFRVHPVEMMIYQLRQLLVISFVGGVFLWLFQTKVSGLAILGVDAFGILFNFFGANLRHSHIPLHFGQFERFFISPAQHQIHHSKDLNHRNRNFGTCLAIWDQLSGTWLEGKVSKPLNFGLFRSPKT